MFSSELSHKIFSMKWDAPQFSTLANVQGRCQMASSSRASQAWKVQLPSDIADQWEFDGFFFAKRQRKKPTEPHTAHVAQHNFYSRVLWSRVFGAETSRIKFRSCWRKEIAVSQMHEFRANGTRGGLQKGSRKGCLKKWTLLPTCCSSLQVCWQRIPYVLDCFAKMHGIWSMLEGACSRIHFARCMC